MRGIRSTSVHLLSAVLASALAACGGGVALEDFDRELIDALCDRAVRCGVYVSAEACRADAVLSVDEVKSAVEGGRHAYDEDKAEACLDALRSASCDQTSEDSRVVDETCRGALRGKVADGGVCFENSECVSEACLIPSCEMACCEGTCGVAIPVPAIGQACPNFVCVDGAFCDEQTTTCVALRGPDEGCFTTSECGYGLYCGPGQKCVDAPDRGQACENGFCSGIGDRCDEGTRTCVGLSGRGGPCREGFAGSFDCQQPLECNQTSLTCQDRPALGQPCTGTCQAGAFCNNGQPALCEAKRAAGQACLGDDECASNLCDQDAAQPVCVEPPVCG